MVPLAYLTRSLAVLIVQTPDNEFVIASNRLAPIFEFPNPDPKNSTKIKSDSIVTFKPSKSGKLEFVELVASGGLNPRHFSLNHDGSKIAVANQVSRTVVVWSRDVKSGKTKKQVASAYHLGPGELT
jgi:6-phosphogluconolactonase (cycloisomerase 2 family)